VADNADTIPTVSTLRVPGARLFVQHAAKQTVIASPGREPHHPLERMQIPLRHLPAGFPGRVVVIT